MKNIILLIFLFTTLGVVAQEQTNPFVVNEKVENLLAQRTDCYGKTKTSLKYYHIQLYNGQNINKARSIKTKFLEHFPGTYAIVEWESPEFKVWVGEYENKLSADQALKRIRNIYPNAFIVNPKD